MNLIWINFGLLALSCSCLGQESNLKAFMYSLPEPTNELLAPMSSERVYYANAPYSVFHTQINVQSQDNEYSTGTSTTNGNATLLLPAAAGEPMMIIRDVNPAEQADTSAAVYFTRPLPPLYASNSNAAKAFQNPRPEESDMRYLRPSNPQSVYFSPADQVVYAPAASNMRWIMTPYNTPESSNQYEYEDTNIQGINVLNSNLGFLPMHNLPKIHASSDNNIQGVNVLNSNIYDLTPNLHDILRLNGLGMSPQSVLILPENTKMNSIQQADANEREESVKQQTTAEVMDIVYLPPVETALPKTAEKPEDILLRDDGYHYKKPSIAFVY